jgi:hypothetical protein
MQGTHIGNIYKKVGWESAGSGSNKNTVIDKMCELTAVSLNSHYGKDKSRTTRIPEGCNCG